MFLDIVLPGMDGFLVCQAIRKESDTSKTPIIFISALSRERHKESNLQCRGKRIHCGNPLHQRRFGRLSRNGFEEVMIMKKILIVDDAQNIRITLKRCAFKRGQRA